MSRSDFSKFAVKLAAFACVGVMGATHSLAAVSSEDVKHMTSARYQFRPSAVSALAGLDADADVTADAPARLMAAVQGGRWKDVAVIMADVPPVQAGAVYRQILSSLGDGMTSGRTPGRDALQPADVLGLADALPAGVPMSPTDVAATGELFRKTLSVAGPSADVLAAMKNGNGRFGEGSPAKRADTAAMLMAAGDLDWAKAYLPDPDAVLAANDPATDRLFFRYAIPAAKAAEDDADDRTAARLRDVAFRLALRAMLRPDGATPEAVGTAFDLAGKTNQSHVLFDALRPLVKANAPSLRAVLAAAAVMPPDKSSETLQARIAGLEMQADLATSIIESLPPDAPADDVRVNALNIFAANWATEASLTIGGFKSSGAVPPPPSMGARGNNGQPAPKQMTPELIWARAPLGGWRDRVGGPLRTAMDRNLIAIAMYLNNADEALTILADLAKTYPQSDDIAAEAITSWAKQHQTVRINPMLSGQYQPVGIPLTLVAQNRNIDGLVSMLARVKQIYGRPFPMDRVPPLFDMLYSQAEVYQVADMERVFGPLDKLDTPTLTKLCDQMYGNLLEGWLFPSVQNASGTGRNEEETYKAVVAGYETLKNLLADRAKQTQDPALYRRLSDVLFQYADVTLAMKLGYGAYNAHRDEAFDAMHQAVALGNSNYDAISTGQTYVTWFTRSLGAANFKNLSSRSLFSEQELDRLKTAITALPPATAASVREALLNAVSAQLDAMRSDARYRIVQAVLRVAGDDPNARGLLTLTRYYDDLISEVTFVAQVDGTPQVGTAPFGIMLNLRHTDRLEHEVKGFAKYVQNQYQNLARIPGRAASLVNYKDELEKHIRSSLSAAYDVQSIVWAPDDVASRKIERQNWRETPMCYVTVKAKDASADRVPSVQIDLDFADRINEVVLPIASGELVVDATHAAPRPVGNLAVEQTLNDHNAKDGKLELTVTANGNGLMPPLDQVIDLTNLLDLKVDAVQDTGSQTDRLDVPADSAVATTVVSHRKWVVTMSAKSRGALPAVFHFPQLAAAASQVAVTYRQYSDADIVDAASQITLAGVKPEDRRTAWPWAIAGVVIAAGAAAGLVAWLRRRKPVTGIRIDQKPVDSSPFGVLTRLQKLNRSPESLTPAERDRLAGDIRLLERHYFGSESQSSDELELAGISDRWR